VKNIYAARHATPLEERNRYANGVVEDVAFPKTPKFVCHVGPMAMALHIAAALNVCEFMQPPLLEELSKALVGAEKERTG